MGRFQPSVVSRAFALGLLPLAGLVAQGDPQPRDASAARAPDPGLPDAGLVVVHDAAAGYGGYGLGDGGIATLERDRPVALEKGICLTPGGVRVHSLRQGTKLTFPNGRELLLAPDGYLHLYGGAVAGPFPGGVELRLGDDSTIRFDRNGSRRTPITQVVVTAGGRALRVWRRSKAVAEDVRALRWAGERLLCLGDGGALYRPLGLGPLITLERLLVPEDQESRLPAHRLAIDLDALMGGIAAVLDDHARDDSPSLRRLRLFAQVGREVLASSKRLPIRVGSKPLRFVLARGYTIEFRADPAVLRMRLGRVDRAAFAEWKLGYRTSAHTVELDRPYGGRAIAMAPAAPELAARMERNEMRQALAVFEVLRRGQR